MNAGGAALEQVFVVVPAYNEAPVIGDVVAELRRTFPHVVAVNDGSTDDTAEVLARSGAVVVTHAVNLGQGAALQTGITYALEHGAAYVITFDADGQHRPEDALALLHEVRAGGCDVVYGSRFLAGATSVPRARRLLLKAAVRFSNFTTKSALTDAHNGLRAFSRKAAAALDISQNRMAHASEITSQLLQKQMVIREVPVRIRYTEYSRAKGQSSLNAIDILIDLFVGRLLR